MNRSWYVRGIGTVALVALILTGCKTSTGEALGTGGGAVLGGLLGSQIGSGSGRLVATAAGAVIGSQLGRVIGGELEKALTEDDQVNATNAAVGAASEGGTKKWDNPDTGVKGQAEVVSTEQREERVEVRVLKDRVETPPPLELIGEPRVVKGSAVNVRGGPGTNYKIVDRLQADDQVHAVGRVKDRDWVLAARSNTAIGYIHETLIRRPEPGKAVPAEQETVPQNETEVATISTQQECRDVKQDVTLADGTTKTHTTTLCRTPSGWAPKNA